MKKSALSKSKLITELFVIYTINLEGEKSFFAGFVDHGTYITIDWDKVGAVFYALESEAISVVPDIIAVDDRRPRTIYVAKVGFETVRTQINPRDRSLRGGL